jgi:hypothetical protein
MSSTPPDETGLDPELARFAQGADGGSSLDPEAMFHEVQGRIAGADRSPAWWLRSRPTVVRRGIGLVVFAALAVLAIFALPRPDMGVYPVGRMAASLVGLGALLSLAIVTALRPLHEPAIGRGRGLLIVAAALLATLVVTGLPPAHHAHPASLGGTGEELLTRAAPCLYFGLLVGLPVYVLVRLLDRGSMLGALLAASAAGLAANFVLQVHCPITATAHQVLAHFTVAAIFVAGIYVLEAVTDRWRTRA